MNLLLFIECGGSVTSLKPSAVDAAISGEDLADRVNTVPGRVLLQMQRVSTRKGVGRLALVSMMCDDGHVLLVSPGVLGSAFLFERIHLFTEPLVNV